MQLFLCPQVRYELKDGDELTFADVHCVYLKSSNKQQVMIMSLSVFNPLKSRGVNWLHFAIHV